MFDMKLSARLSKWGAVGALALATTALAQKEQWLDYHVNREGRGYVFLDLTTNRPPNLKFPKCNATPYFAQWTTPMDPAGRWVCLDRTRKSGLYDRLYLDTTGNGRLDDKTPVGTMQRDQYSATFEPVRVVFKGEDGPVTYHLIFRFMQYGDDEARLYASSAGYYAGKVDIGGKKRLIELIDENVNGTFNDRGPDMSDADGVSIDEGKLGEWRLGKMLEADGQFYQIEVARDGAFIKLQKAENVKLGQVRVPEAIKEFVAYGENGHFTRKPAKGEFTLPVGAYRIQGWKIDRKDAKGATWHLDASGFNESARFEVAASKPVTLEVGEPMRLALRFTRPFAGPEVRVPTNQLTFNLGFEGHYGESVQIMKGNERPPGPRLTLTSLDGTYRHTNTFEFG
jgi:hypothetical protein